ncbi:unnamed protein product [Clonostachys byssicola]|uniref:Rhodopsin domain-containing protein n=1 Tax=Clonostachys byssicola TaxID=160290 RepID=A0A9N9Y3D6_9HYPO|nr:unnamed protein product [Clonostachys byssicola]
MSSPFDAVPADQFPAEWVAQNKGPSILGVCITVTVLSTLFVIMRLFTRQKIMGELHLDDYLVTLATFSEWANVAMAIMAVKSGNGKHFALLTKDEKQNAIFWTILGFPFGIVAFGLPKLAVASLLVRLMNPNKYNKIALWAVSSLCFATLLGCVVILYAQCTPAYSQWNFDVAGSCISKWVLVDYAIFAGGFSAFVDLYLAIYPASVLWTLQINLRKKIALCVALGIGSIATVVAIYKCTRLPSLAGADFSLLADMPSTRGSIVSNPVTGSVESSTIIIACCIPVLRPLVDVLFGRRMLGGSSAYKYRYGTSGADRYGQSHGGDVELSKGSRLGGRNPNNSHLVSNHTMGSLAGDPEVESQESILPKKGHTNGSTSGDRNHQITRTDVVTVTYNEADSSSDHPVTGNGSPASGLATTSWVKI